MNFKTILDSWHLTYGHPLLTVQYDRDTGNLNLSQEIYNPLRYILYITQTWWIPYNFITSKDTNIDIYDTLPDGWLSTTQQTLQPPSSRNWKDADWVVFNRQNTGHYRTNYDHDNWMALAQALRGDDFNKIPYMTRANLIQDSIHFAFYGINSFDTTFEIMKYLPEKENDYFPWRAAFEGFTSISSRIHGSPHYQKFMVK